MCARCRARQEVLDVPSPRELEDERREREMGLPDFRTPMGEIK